MSEAHKHDDHGHKPEAKAAAPEAAHVEHKADPAVKKHIEDISAMEMKKLQDALTKHGGGAMTEQQARQIRVQAGYIAQAEHDIEHHLPLTSYSLAHRVEYERAVERKALAEYQMHEIIHPTKYGTYDPRRLLPPVPAPDWRRLVKTMDENKAATAAVGAIGVFGAYELGSFLGINEAISAASSAGATMPGWLSPIVNGGYILGGAVAGGLLGRWLGGFVGRRLEKKGIITEKGAKTAGTILGAGGTTLAMSFATNAAGTAAAFSGGPLTLGIGVGAWALLRAYKRYFRRNRAVALHETLDMQMIGKERKRIEEADIYNYMSATEEEKKEAVLKGEEPKKEGFTKTTEVLFEKLKKMDADDENKNLEAAIKDEESLIENVRKLKEAEKAKDAVEAREKIERARRELERHIIAAEKFAQKAKSKGPELRKKTVDKAKGLEAELSKLEEKIIKPMREADEKDQPPQLVLIEAAIEKLNSAIEAAKEADVALPTPSGWVPLPGGKAPDPVYIKNEEVERLLNDAVQAMDKVHGLIEKVSEMKAKERENKKKVEAETAARDGDKFKKRELAMKKSYYEAKKTAAVERKNTFVSVEGERSKNRIEVAKIMSGKSKEIERKRLVEVAELADQELRDYLRNAQLADAAALRSKLYDFGILLSDHAANRTPEFWSANKSRYIELRKDIATLATSMRLGGDSRALAIAAARINAMFDDPNPAADPPSFRDPAALESAVRDALIASRTYDTATFNAARNALLLVAKIGADSANALKIRKFVDRIDRGVIDVDADQVFAALDALRAPTDAEAAAAGASA